jgi:hypothetical protein
MLLPLAAHSAGSRKAGFTMDTGPVSIFDQLSWLIYAAVFFALLVHESKAVM